MSADNPVGYQSRRKNIRIIIEEINALIITTFPAGEEVLLFFRIDA